MSDEMIDASRVDMPVIQTGHNWYTCPLCRRRSNSPVHPLSVCVEMLAKRLDGIESSCAYDEPGR